MDCSIEQFIFLHSGRHTCGPSCQRRGYLQRRPARGPDATLFLKLPKSDLRKMGWWSS